MFKTVKKTLAIASVAAFALSLVPVALAAGPAKENRNNSGNTQMVQAQSMKADSQGNSLMKANQVQNKTQKNNQIMQREREGFCGMEWECAAAAIAGLSEEDAETLSTYIDAYEDAVAAAQAAFETAEEGADLSDYREAVCMALQDLLDAAEEAGIALEPAACGQVSWMNGKDHGMNPGSVASSIAKLTEEDAETLSTYVDAYEAAVSAEQAAVETAEEGADLSNYREAVRTALQNMLNAGEENGISLQLAVCDQASWMNGKGHGMNPGAVASSIAKLSTEDKETLDTYIDAYEDAVAAKRAALASAVEGTDLSSYCEAVQTALQDLLDAAADAGVELIPVPVSK
ncbi:MAG: hypothetical protein AB7E30_09150 [Lawsonibacter sp.]